VRLLNLKRSDGKELMLARELAPECEGVEGWNHGCCGSAELLTSAGQPQNSLIASEGVIAFPYRPVGSHIEVARGYVFVVFGACGRMERRLRPFRTSNEHSEDMADKT
jgi:hypothetical protein